MRMYTWIVLNLLVGACAHRMIVNFNSSFRERNHACNKEELGVEHGSQCATFSESTGLGIEWVEPLACASKSFRVIGVTQGCYIRLYEHKKKCENILNRAGFKLADEKDMHEKFSAVAMQKSGQEFIIGDGLHAVIYWTPDFTEDNVGAVIAFRWQETDDIDTEQAFYWFAKPGARFLKGLWLPNFAAQAVTGAKDHRWASSAAELVKAVQAVQPGKRIVFTGFSLGSVCAQLMSILHSQTGLVNPAVVFGGNGVQHVLGLESWWGPLNSLTWQKLREAKQTSHPYIYNFIDPGDHVPRIDCQLGTVCALPESFAGTTCTKAAAGLNVSAAQSMTHDCWQCETHLKFMLADKFLDAFQTQGPSAFSCVVGQQWPGAPSYCGR